MRIDIGKLTPEETQLLLRQIINVLPETLLLEVLKDTLTMDQIDELVESLP